MRDAVIGDVVIVWRQIDFGRVKGVCADAPAAGAFEAERIAVAEKVDAVEVDGVAALACPAHGAAARSQRVCLEVCFCCHALAWIKVWPGDAFVQGNVAVERGRVCEVCFCVHDGNDK